MPRRTKLIAALALCVCVFLICAGVITVRLVSEYKSDQLNESLRALAGIPAETEVTAAAGEAGDGLSASASPYTALYEMNQDFTGWLSIPGTSIDYPVMQTPDDPEYYIDKDFNGDRDANGTLFLDGRCTPESGNLIVYGHNMKSGRMFGTLEEYENEAYYREHPKIRFDTLAKQGTYEIIAVFISQVYPKDSDEFKFYVYTEFPTREAFDAFIYNIKAVSLYDTGVEAGYGDSLLTLTTCEYLRDNGRFVVVARKQGLTDLEAGT